MLLGKRNSLFFSLFVKDRRKAAERLWRGPFGHFEAVPGTSKRPAVCEVNFLLGRQEHVQWPAEGLSWTDAPGASARPRTFTRCGALTPNLIQSALHPPPC